MVTWIEGILLSKSVAMEYHLNGCFHIADILIVLAKFIGFGGCKLTTIVLILNSVFLPSAILFRNNSLS